MAGLALAALYLSTMSGDYQGKRREAVRHAATWIVIALGLIVAYTYREELKTVAYRVAGEVLPPATRCSWKTRRPASRPCACAVTTTATSSPAALSTA